MVVTKRELMAARMYIVRNEDKHKLKHLNKTALETIYLSYEYVDIHVRPPWKCPKCDKVKSWRSAFQKAAHFRSLSHIAGFFGISTSRLYRIVKKFYKIICDWYIYEFVDEYWPKETISDKEIPNVLLCVAVSPRMKHDEE